MTVEILLTLVLVVLGGAAWAVVGVRAWSGAYRSWVRHGWGYRLLAGAFFGPGMVLFTVGALVGQVVLPLGGVLVGLGVLLLVAGFLYVVAALVTEDRFYPRWYRELPQDERQW